MNLKQAKDYYEHNIIKALTAVAVDGNSGWLLLLETTGKDEGYTLQTALGKDKLYTSLDSLNRDVERILGHHPEMWSYRL